MPIIKSAKKRMRQNIKRNAANRMRRSTMRTSIRQLQEAIEAVQALEKDPERTEMVFEITQALAGSSPERLLRRLRGDPAGRRLLEVRPVFDPSTCDLDALLALPAGSFGRVFAEWMRLNDFRPGLMDRPGADDADPDLAYLGKRLTQVHDFWHVLSGYNRDPVGEIGVLAFGWAQMHSYGIGYILGTVLWRSLREAWRQGRLASPLVGYMWRAYRAGRRARFLLPVPPEELLPLPLDQARTTLGIEPLREAIAPDALPPIAVGAV